MTRDRPVGVSALTALFAFGALMSLIAGLALSWPGSFLEPMWGVNPRGRDGLSTLGPWGIVLMFCVSGACALSASGLWSGAARGRRLATAILVVNLVGDAVSALSGAEPRAALGIPIGAALVAYLWSARVTAFFDREPLLAPRRSATSD